MLLTYVPKRIHFGTATFLMRMNLAVMDWVRTLCLSALPGYACYYSQKNSQRACTSERLYLDMRRTDRTTPLKVFTEKSFSFVDQVWDSYMAKNMEDLKYVITHM